MHFIIVQETKTVAQNGRDYKTGQQDKDNVTVNKTNAREESVNCKMVQEEYVSYYSYKKRNHRSQSEGM